VVDRYGEVLVMEIGCAGLEPLANFVADMIVAAASRVAPVSRVILNNDVPVRRKEGLSLEPRTIEVSGDAPPEVVVMENGLRYFVEPGKGQKTGFFLDQRDNRLVARELGRGRQVLNLFAYTGGFGVSAAAGGAASVEEVDVSAPAIAVARRNHELNGSSCELIFTTADVFDHVRVLRGAARRFGLVVVDPPAFAKSKKDLDRASRGYKDVIMNGLHLVEPGGALMAFSCSGHVSQDLFQKIVFGAAIDARREVSIVRRLGAGEDHPVSIYCPEGEYLKGLVLRVG
jgi:23S rRNA (cytosine1962-C5)-methyltransferase